MAYRFRDRSTGRFASASTWKRSKSHGGTSYVRESVKPKPAEVEGEKPPAPEKIKSLSDYEAYGWEDGYEYEDIESSADYVASPQG